MKKLFYLVCISISIIIVSNTLCISLNPFKDCSSAEYSLIWVNIWSAVLFYDYHCYKKLRDKLENDNIKKITVSWRDYIAEKDTKRLLLCAYGPALCEIGWYFMKDYFI